MAYERKTIDRWDLMANYGDGWEAEWSDYSRQAAMQTLRKYSENGPGIYRLEKHREPKRSQGGVA